MGSSVSPAQLFSVHSAMNPTPRIALFVRPLVTNFTPSGVLDAPGVLDASGVLDAA